MALRWIKTKNDKPDPRGIVFGLTCSWCGRDAPMPKLLGLYEMAPQAKRAARQL